MCAYCKADPAFLCGSISCVGSTCFLRQREKPESFGLRTVCKILLNLDDFSANLLLHYFAFNTPLSQQNKLTPNSYNAFFVGSGTCLVQWEWNWLLAVAAWHRHLSGAVLWVTARFASYWKFRRIQNILFQKFLSISCLSSKAAVLQNSRRQKIMHCIFIKHDCWYWLTFISALERRPDNSFVAGKLNVITRIACYRYILSLSINFVNPFMALMKGHVINQACAFVLPGKGVHTEIHTVLGTGTEMWNIKWLPMDDGREQGMCMGPHKSMALCALAISEARWEMVWRANPLSRTWWPWLGHSEGWLIWTRSCSVGECSFVHSETTLQWEQLRGLPQKCPAEALV